MTSAGRYPSGVRIAVVVSGWPRVSETFALNELRALQRAGMLAGVFATKPGDDRLVQPGVADIDPPAVVLAAGDGAAQAAELASRLQGTGVTAVHGYFAHRPAEVAAGAARILGVPYSFSAHALDVRKVPAGDLAARAADAALVVACTHDVARSLEDAGSRPRLLPHGVDLDRFRPQAPPGGPQLAALAVGRFVEKKGFVHAIRALALTQRPVRLRLVGDGPLLGILREAADAAGVADRVTFAGRRTHDSLAAEYAAADVVVVPSVVDASGDRDGLPNVVLEAMASGRPVVAADVAAIASAVAHGATGVLVPPADPAAIAWALDELHDDPAARRRMGAAARAVAEERYDLDACAGALCRTLERAYA
ncbi:MAG: glycosyltransferase [Thermoleophilia bacterium]